VLNSAKIDEIAKAVAIQHLSPEAIDDVISHDTVDSQGRDAVRITIKLKAKAAEKLNGDDVLDTLVAIQSQLAKHGEERLSIVEYEEAGEVIEADDVGRRSEIRSNTSSRTEPWIIVGYWTSAVTSRSPTFPRTSNHTRRPEGSVPRSRRSRPLSSNCKRSGTAPTMIQ
jgi:hypothetical protein